MHHQLKASHLRKIYHKRAVVNNTSLSVADGQVIGLLGPNGAGKTTMFYMMVGLIRADQGQIFLDKTDISHLSIDQRARLGIGYLPQEPSIFRKLTVRENIEAILELHQPNRKNREDNLQSLLTEFHLKEIEHHMGYTLSGGERRRVEIARSLAAEPKFILLDEPFAGIDPISVVDIKNIIQHLCQRGIGILITDHNVRETLDICHKAYIVSQGEIICEGTSDIVLANEKVREVYLGHEFEL